MNLAKFLKIISNVFVISFFTIILFELISYFLTINKLLNFYNIPSYSFSENNKTWFERDEILGVWHKKKFSFIKKTVCHNVEYKSNDVGSRSNFNYLNIKLI